MRYQYFVFLETVFRFFIIFLTVLRYQVPLNVPLKMPGYWLKSDTSSAVGRSYDRERRREFRAVHCKDLTETGNGTRKVFGTQGRDQ